MPTDHCGFLIRVATIHSFVSPPVAVAPALPPTTTPSHHCSLRFSGSESLLLTCIAVVTIHWIAIVPLSSESPVTGPFSGMRSHVTGASFSIGRQVDRCPGRTGPVERIFAKVQLIFHSAQGICSAMRSTPSWWHFGAAPGEFIFLHGLSHF